MNTRNKITQIVLLIIPLIVVTLLYKLSYISFHLCDDTYMDYYASGHFLNQPDEHMVFINSTIGYLIKVLYMFCKTINWTAIVYLLVVLASVYLLLRILNRYVSFYIACFISYCMGAFCIYYFTFTTVGYICSLVAIIYFVETIAAKNILKDGILTIVLFAVAYSIRSSTLISALVLLIPLIVISLKRIENKKQVVALIMCIVAIIISLSTINQLSYKSSKWKDYQKYNSARGKIVDYPLPDYKQNKQLYKNINYSENDYNCLKKGILGDKKVFSKKNFNTINTNKPFKEKYSISIKRWIQDLIELNYSSWKLGILSIMLLLAFGLFLTIKNRKKAFFLTQTSMCACQIIYLFVVQRPVVRVIFSIVIVGITAFIYHYLKNKEDLLFLNINNKKIKKIIIMCAMVGLIVFVFYKGKVSYDFNVYNSGVTHRINAYTKSNKNKLIIKAINVKYYNCLSIDKKDPLYNIDNSVPIGYWGYYSDIYYKHLNKMKIESKDQLLLNLVKNKAYLMVDDNSTAMCIEMFLREHYKKDIKKKIIHTVDNSNIKIYSFLG